MAVKKANTKATEKIDVEVTAEVIETPEVEIPEVEVEEPKVEEPKIEVNEKATEAVRPTNGSVKIRMRVDHKCCIAMERYDLKAGKTYTVPENVKRILNNAGLLAPL